MFSKHLSRQLAAYVDGALTPRRSQEVEAHLARCAHCRAEFERVRLGMAMVGRLPLAEAPKSLWTSIATALEEPEKTTRPSIRTWRLAPAAVLVTLAVVAYWFIARQPRAEWEVVSLGGSPAVGSEPIAETGRIGAGEWIETDGSSRARIKIGEIGSVDVEPNTRLRVVAARAGEHRLALRNGEILARITAPPRLFFVETPSGTAVDMGCEYTLQCDESGLGSLRVTQGWVSFEWEGRESLVPAGASCRTRPRLGPGTPYFDDAPGPFVRALETFDFENAGSSALDIVLAESRSRDTLTLWHLLSRVGAGERRRVYERMAEFSPPPADAPRGQILNLDPGALHRWREELAWTW